MLTLPPLTVKLAIELLLRASVPLETVALVTVAAAPMVVVPV